MFQNRLVCQSVVYLMNSPSIGIVGVGMVGTPLSRFFEEVRKFRRGHDIFLYDIDPRKGFGDDVKRADIIFISVPTPRSENGAASLGAVESAVGAITGSKIIVIKSTVPPGTTEKLQTRFPQHKFLFNPEFLREANAWENTVRPDRQLVGWTEKSRDAAQDVLALLPEAPLSAPSSALDLRATEAELVKYAANMFLTRKVTFANAIYDIAARLAVDYEKVMAGIASDSRIGPSHLEVRHGGYRGYGGYCFVKDTDGLIAHAKEIGLENVSSLFEADRKYNAELLKAQGLTPEDVSVHDHEWIAKKLESRIQNAESRTKKDISLNP